MRKRTFVLEAPDTVSLKRFTFLNRISQANLPFCTISRHSEAGPQPGGDIWGICHPEIFKNLHRNSDICRNFQRI